MKAYYKIGVTLLTVIVLSCDFGKNDSPDHSTTGRTVPENKEITNTTNYNKTGNFDAVDNATTPNAIGFDSLNENWNLDNPKRKKSLYTEFKMSQDQIKRYEEALQRWKESDKGDAYKILSANEKIKEEARIMKKILDDSQYAKYIEWSKANDQRP